MPASYDVMVSASAIVAGPEAEGAPIDLRARWEEATGFERFVARARSHEVLEAAVVGRA